VRQWLSGLAMGVVCLGGAGLAWGGLPVATHAVAIEKSAAPSGPPAGRYILDYGSYWWVGADDADVAQLQASRVPQHLERDAFAITLGERTFDPVRDGVPPTHPALRSAGLGGKDLKLVQFVGPTKKEWLAELEAGGAEIIQYIHPFTYIVWADSNQLENEKISGVVRWKGEFEPAYRILPNALAETSRAGGKVDCRVLIVRPAGEENVLVAARALGVQVTDAKPIHERLSVAAMQLTADEAVEVARIPGVYSVQTQPTDGGLRGEMQAQVCVNNVDGTNLAFVGYPNWLTDAGVTGAGVLIANVDGGIRDTHADLVNRMVPCVGGTPCGSGSTESGHGTHTAGIMAGDGSSGVRDTRGFLRGLGIAPGAQLVELLYSPTYTQPGGMLTLIRHSYAQGALLSGNSWGPAGTPRGYDNDTLQCDQGVRDADPNTPGNQQFTYVLSFMNGNGGTSSQGTPDEGKNLFTIGSTKMQQSSSGAQILQINDLSSNSGHGPALDGRTIPHMVAPGCYVDSTYTGSGYSLQCGTSMASPAVSGGVALFFEYYRSLPDYVSDPSPALVKAAFLAVARNLAGNRDADNGILGQPFDSKQGWGRFDLDAVIRPTTSVRYFDAPVLLSETGEEWVQTVSAEDPSAPVRIMLVWTDAPGHGLGGSTAAWNNNLDLIVSDGTNTYRGNQFGSNGWSIPSASSDTRNNTEGVFIGPTSGGAYTITVRATNLTSDGVPGNGDPTDQDFALVCYNCALEPTFTVAAAPATQSLCAPADAVFQIDVGQILEYSEPVTFAVGGDLGPMTADFTVNPVLPGGSTILTIGNTGAVPTGDRVLQLTATSGEIVRNTNLTLKIFAGVPEAATLTTPAEGATGVALRPNFAWEPLDGAQTYSIDVSTSPDFSSLAAAATGLTETTWQPGADLLNGTTYYWRVRGGNACGDGDDSATGSFTTRIVPAILLVDDDDNSPDVRATYTAALAALNEDYDVWNTNNTDNEPTAADLSAYRIVIWFTGDEFGGACGPGTAGEAALATWLNSGGRGLFISSQDYHYDRSRTSFMSNYLGAASVINDEAQNQATAVAGGIFEGMGPYSLSYSPLSNYSDNIHPDATALAAFNGQSGLPIAITKEADDYKTVFFVFPWEALPNTEAEQAVLARIIEWFRESSGPMAGDMNCDGVVSVSDIAAFVVALTDPDGYAAQYPQCDMLVGDMNGDGQISVSDIGGFVALLTGN
jgi:serine protease AprX